MPDVFLSYAREDREFARRLAEALEKEGFSVWWDWDLIGGSDYRAHIREAIREAKKAIVLWSRHSVASGFVIDEASESRKLGKLVPVLIDTCETPFGFGDLHTMTLDAPDKGLAPLVAALRNQPAPRAASPAPPRRLLAGVAAAVAVLCLIGGGAYWLMREAPASLPAVEASATPPVQAVTPAVAAPAPKPTIMAPRIALVIGNDKYVHLPALQNAGRDAERIATELEARGFKVVKEIDADRETMIRALTEFETTLSVVGGTGVFYYSGTAVYMDGEDIMVPIDGQVDEAQRGIAGGVNLNKLFAEVQSRTTQKARDNGVAVIYSASKGETASDGIPGDDSPFAKAFIKALAEPGDELGGNFRKIRAEMEADTTGALPTKQTPYFENSLGSAFYFNRPEDDPASGVSRILIFDSCRDNPFDVAVADR